jgi:single-stranded DNA-binding protein
MIRMNFQQVTIVGNATDDAEKKTSQKGDVEYATFDVGVSDGKDRTTFFPVVVFGDFSETVAKYVTKGREVLVSGRIRVSDKGRFNVVADTVRFGNDPHREKDTV